ncbi:MAG: hypothetical protein KDA20_03195 [Phycisphaerales bacterium]|nr:hypothetical protein [Phycisphaerales bacterium]
MRAGVDSLQQLYGSGKPWFFVHAAAQIAASADGIGEVLRLLLDDKRPWLPESQLPSVKEWLSLYRQHRRVQATAFEAYAGQPLEATMREPSQEEQEFLLRMFIGVSFESKGETFQRAIDGVEDGLAGDDESFDRFTTSSEGLFFFRVWLPCWLVYHKLPGQLLREARLGDDDALDKLLRLDKSVLGDPGIAQRWHAITLRGSALERRRLVAALKGKPKGSFDGAWVRSGLAGMISQMAKTFGCTATAPEIAAIFDAVEQRNGNLVDSKLPVGESLAKAIQRNRDWPGLPRLPDVK